MDKPLATEPATDPLDGMVETMDRAAFSAIAQLTHGLSPATMMQAWSDWAMHLAVSPGKQTQLGSKALRKWLRLSSSLSLDPKHSNPAIEPLPQDRRFDDVAWSQWPYSAYSQGFLLSQQWWHAATTGVMGVTRHHEAIVEFTARQILDTIAPSNFIATSPVLQRRIAETGGKCLVDGFNLFVEDVTSALRGDQAAFPEDFVIGETVAATPGKVVYRNRLMELIQYEPATETVRPEPVLIVPAWIMKYYILDLSANNSLIGWLVSQGYTVFAISWHNPTREDRDLDLDDYRLLGPMAALDAIETITGQSKIHALGYCLGGTLMSIAAAAMARDKDHRLASLTLLAAQTEFSEPGELGLFIDEAQINLLENMMWSSGFLDASQMGGAFQLLRSNDLIWSRVLKSYLMGERDEPNDLMAWNADGTRLPYVMHSQYLRQLFLEDALAEGHFKAGGRSVSLSSLRQPIFLVATESDHVAPWRSVHKLHRLTSADITFVLTSGGHNAGIVSEPGHPHRHFRILERGEGEAALAPEEWCQLAEQREGSWWLAWGEWLDQHSGEPGKPPPMGDRKNGYPVLMDAPGTYVLER